MSLALIVALLVSAVSASFACLGTPPVANVLQKGDSCGGVFPCATGLYCDKSATCSPAISNGDACQLNVDCPFQSACNGPVGSQVCVANANPGSNCTGDPTMKGANCPHCFGGVCMGQLGDGCKADTDCSTGSCHNGACASLCAPNTFCTIGETCSISAGNPSVCQKLKTSGTCMLDSDCAPNYRCMATSVKKTASTCVKAASIADGNWCDRDNSYANLLCTGGLCWRNKCISKAPLVTESLFTCPAGQVGTCDNGYLIYGSGPCKADKCATPIFALTQCIATCGAHDASVSLSYSNSCAYKTCSSQYNAYLACDPNSILLKMMQSNSIFGTYYFF